MSNSTDKKSKELKVLKGMRLPSLYSKDPIYHKASFGASVPYIAQSLYSIIPI
jgi:hypothetical protein